MIDIGQITAELKQYLRTKEAYQKLMFFYMEPELATLKNHDFICFLFDSVSSYNVLSGINSTEEDQTFTLRLIYGMQNYDFAKLSLGEASYADMTLKIKNLLDTVREAFVERTDDDPEHTYNHIGQVYYITADIEMLQTDYASKKMPIADITLTCYFNETFIQGD